MAARSSWKGYLKFSLVSMPVKAYSATTSEGGGIKLNQLHVDCHSRIQQKKVCPVHGEISNDAIVSGYEYAKGQYVIVDTAELDKLRTEDDKAITIDTFIAPDAREVPLRPAPLHKLPGSQARQYRHQRQDWLAVR